MLFEGIETLNYTEAEYLRLQDTGRETLMRAKAAGAVFKEAPDYGPAPVPRRVQEETKFNPMHIKSHREEAVGLYDYVPTPREERADRDRYGNPVGTKYDQFLNPIFGDGSENI